MSNYSDQLFALLNKNALKIACAESCTGGLIASLITQRTGSSAIFERGYVTYSNEAKIECLNVNATTIETHGAVSNQTALEMAKGALKNSHADIAISVTGVAGPNGGTEEKPVGTVYVGYADENTSIAKHFKFKGSRNEIQQQSTEAALEIAFQQLTTPEP